MGWLNTNNLAAERARLGAAPTLVVAPCLLELSIKIDHGSETSPSMPGSPSRDPSNRLEAWFQHGVQRSSLG